MPRDRQYKYMLVVVNQLTGWPEAHAVTRATALAMARTLLQEIVPRFRPPRVIESDQGQHFTAEVVKHLSEAIGTHWKFQLRGSLNQVTKLSI